MKTNNDGPTFLEPLRSISPTGFIAAGECGLKLVWQRNGNPALLPASPKTRVGTVSHQLLAEAGQGSLKPTVDDIDARWDELVAEVDTAIGSSQLERHLAPLTNSVPDIEVRRICATQKALVIASQTEASPRKAGNPASPPQFGHEIPVRSSDGLVRGTIDAVILGAGNGIIIQDYKSGSIAEPDDASECRLRESYQTQLKMYAGLYAETFGEWPASLELVPLTGKTRTVMFTRNGCSILVAEAKTTLWRLNEAVENHSSDSLPSVLANPSPEACAFCQYRPACGPYKIAFQESDEKGWPLDIIGAVKSVRQLGNSKIMLELTVPNGSVYIPGLSPGERHPILQSLKSGDSAGVFNLRRSRPGGPYSESLRTTVHRLP